MNTMKTFDDLRQKFQLKTSEFDFNTRSFHRILNYFIIKYPVSKFYLKIESTPISLIYNNGILQYNKIKKSKLLRYDDIFSQEFFKIDFNNLIVDYQEEKLKEKENTLIEQQIIQEKKLTYKAKFLYIKNFKKENIFHMDTNKQFLLNWERKKVMQKTNNVQLIMEELRDYKCK